MAYNDTDISGIIEDTRRRRLEAEAEAKRRTFDFGRTVIPAITSLVTANPTPFLLAAGGEGARAATGSGQDLSKLAGDEYRTATFPSFAKASGLMPYQAEAGGIKYQNPLAAPSYLINQQNLPIKKQEAVTREFTAHKPKEFASDPVKEEKAKLLKTMNEMLKATPTRTGTGGESNATPTAVKVTDGVQTKTISYADYLKNKDKLRIIQ